MKSTLIAAVSEIKKLRRDNEILNAQVQVVHIFAAALGFKQTFGGATPDIVQELQREIDILEAKKGK